MILGNVTDVRRNKGTWKKKKIRGFVGKEEIKTDEGWTH